MVRLALLLNKPNKKMKQVRSLLCHALTLLNAFCGLLAMIKALEGELEFSCYLIIVAAFLDGIDGKLARAFNCTSNFGGELDSLADAITFCGAPMVIMYLVLPNSVLVLSVLGWYLSAGLWRLAKFNSDTKNYANFIGLPTTAAALTIALLLLHAPWLEQHLYWQPSSMLFIVMLLGILMISPFTFKKINRLKWIHIIVSSFVIAAFSFYHNFPIILFVTRLIYF